MLIKPEKKNEGSRRSNSRIVATLCTGMRRGLRRSIRASKSGGASLRPSIYTDASFSGRYPLFEGEQVHASRRLLRHVRRQASCQKYRRSADFGLRARAITQSDIIRRDLKDRDDETPANANKARVEADSTSTAEAAGGSLCSVHLSLPRFYCPLLAALTYSYGRRSDAVSDGKRAFGRYYIHVLMTLFSFFELSHLKSVESRGMFSTCNEFQASRNRIQASNRDKQRMGQPASSTPYHSVENNKGSRDGIFSEAKTKLQSV